MKESDYEEAVINFYEGLYAFGYSLTGKEDDASELNASQATKQNGSEIGAIG